MKVIVLNQKYIIQNTKPCWLADDSNKKDGKLILEKYIKSKFEGIFIMNQMIYPCLFTLFYYI